MSSPAIRGPERRAAQPLLFIYLFATPCGYARSLVLFNSTRSAVSAAMGVRPLCTYQITQRKTDLKKVQKEPPHTRMHDDDIHAKGREWQREKRLEQEERTAQERTLYR